MLQKYIGIANSIPQTCSMNIVKNLFELRKTEKAKARHSIRQKEYVPATMQQVCSILLFLKTILQTEIYLLLLRVCCSLQCRSKSILFCDDIKHKSMHEAISHQRRQCKSRCSFQLLSASMTFSPQPGFWDSRSTIHDRS